jgi:hypothetical protein
MIYFLFPEAQNTNIKICTNTSKAGKTTTRNATSSDATSALNQWTNAVSSYNKTEGNGVFNVDKIDKTANYTTKAGKTGVAVLGSAFECLLALVLCIEDIGPFFMQAELTFVPNAKFDILMYDESGWPISLSIKTSLRERYKQADLEAMALKQVHRNSESYLITLNETEAAAQAQKIEKRELVALDKIILATAKEFDDLIQDLKGRILVDPDQVPVIRYRESEVNSKSGIEKEFKDRAGLL